MPKKIDPAVRERVMRTIAERRLEYATPTALAKVIAARERIGTETVRRMIVQYEIDAGTRPGVTSEENEKIKELKARVRRRVSSSCSTIATISRSRCTTCRFFRRTLAGSALTTAHSWSLR